MVGTSSTLSRAWPLCGMPLSRGRDVRHRTDLAKPVCGARKLGVRRLKGRVALRDNAVGRVVAGRVVSVREAPRPLRAAARRRLTRRAGRPGLTGRDTFWLRLVESSTTRLVA